MSFQFAEPSNRTSFSYRDLVATTFPRFLWPQAVILVLLLAVSLPAGAQVLFPHDYSNGLILTFSGGTPGNDHELRVAQPGGGIVKATEALLDVSFLDHRRVRIAPQNVGRDVYRAFYGAAGAGGSKQVLAAVYIAGTDNLVDASLVVNTTYDPSLHFRDADFEGIQRWTTRVDAVENTTQVFSFAWQAVHAGDKNWRVGDTAAGSAIRCSIGTVEVALLPNAPTNMVTATLLTDETDATGTSGNVSIEFAAPPYDPEGAND